MKNIFGIKMEEKEISANESLQIIQSMIDTAKNKLADDGVLLIFWGWLVFAAAIITYAGILTHTNGAYYAWPLLMPLGGVFSFFYGRAKSKKERVRSYIDTYLGYSWIAFLIALLITLAFMPVHGVKITYFFLMLLYGLATLISGGILNFRPLIIGSVFSFVSAIVSVFAAEEHQYLCIAAAVLFSYIVPGHLLRSHYKSQTSV